MRDNAPGDSRNTPTTSGTPATSGPSGTTSAPRGRPAGHARQGHGHSSAAWVGVVVILVGVCLAAAALTADAHWLFWLGIGIAAVGAVVGKALSMLGFGPLPGYHQEGDVELRDDLFGAGGRQGEPPRSKRHWWRRGRQRGGHE